MIRGKCGGIWGVKYGRRGVEIIGNGMSCGRIEIKGGINGDSKI